MKGETFLPALGFDLFLFYPLEILRKIPVNGCAMGAKEGIYKKSIFFNELCKECRLRAKLARNLLFSCGNNRQLFLRKMKPYLERRLKMNKNITSKLIIGITALALLGVGATAFAGWGRGYGRHMGWGGGPGNCPGYGYGPGASQGSALSDEQIKAMEEERQAFWKATESLRQNLYAKELELRSELAKENPDAKKAVALQKEISAMQSDLDEKRIEHRLEMQKISPYAGRGYMMGRGGKGYGPGYGRGSGKGYGPGYGRGGGRGGYGPGDCGGGGPCWQ
jgi:Spy/CpxP family protein refolding chaperone